MHWAARLSVALLNLIWIVFFLQPDPFSVSVRRRSSGSSDEEEPFKEFCLQLQSHMNWTSPVRSVNGSSDGTNSTNTTAGGSTESNFTLPTIPSIQIQHDCQCNKTNMLQKDLDSSKLLQIELRPPAPGCEPKIIMEFPSMELCVEVEAYFSAIKPRVLPWGDTTPASPPEQPPTSSGVTTASGLTSRNMSADALVTAANHTKETIQKTPARAETLPKCCVRVSNSPITEELKGYVIQRPSPPCLLALIFHTVNNNLYCVNPHAPWARTAVMNYERMRREKRNDEKD